MTHKFFKVIRSHPRLLLLFAIAVTACVVYHQYLFRGYVFLFSDIGSDTSELYVMWYSSIANHLRSGTFSLWDLTNGFGTSMYQLNLFHPLLWIIYLIGTILGPSAIPGSMIYYYILILLLSGLACYSFLQAFHFPKVILLVVSYIYAFNGFVIVWGQHFAFGLVNVLLPLLLLLTERAIKKNQFSVPLSLFTGLAILTNYYMAYMSILAVGVFLFLRLIYLKKKSADVIKYLILHGLSLLLGVGIGGICLFPSIALLFNVTARMSSDYSFPQKALAALHPWGFSYYRALFLRFFSSATVNLDLDIWSPETIFQVQFNYYEMPTVFFSALFPVLIPHYFLIWFRKRKEKKYFIVCGIAVALCFFSLLIPLGSMIFNAFVQPFARFTFVLMPFFAMMSAHVLTEIKRNRWFSCPAIFVGWCILTAGFLYASVNTEVHFYRIVFILVWICISLIVFILIMLSRQQMSFSYSKRLVLFGIVAILLILCTSAEAYTTVYNRAVIQKGSPYYKELYGGDIRELLNEAQFNNDTFYRVEKDYCTASTCMEALAQGYYGISSYNATANRNILEFIERVAPELQFVNNRHWSFTQIADQAQLSDLLGIRYKVSRDPSLSETGWQLVNHTGPYYLYENEYYESFATFFTHTISETDYEAMELNTAQNRDAFLADHLIVETALAENDSNDSLNSEESSSSPADIQVTLGSNESHLSVTIAADENGYLFLPIAYENGWSAAVDGITAPIIRADYGFMAVRLSAGNHIVTFDYVQPMLREGIISSALGLSICLAIWLIQKRHN